MVSAPHLPMQSHRPPVDEPDEVGGVRVRGHLRHEVDQAIADGHALQVDPPLLRHLGGDGLYERAVRGDGLAGAALAGEEEGRARNSTG